MNVSFPLRDGYFRPLPATSEDRARWTQRVHEHVIQSLEEEKPFFESMYETIDSRHWRLVRRKDQLRVFRPRRDRSVHGSRTGAGALPCLLEIGTIEGSLEDVIYGVHSATTPDMRTTTSFLSADALDAAVLAVFENGSEPEDGDDHYRSFALKWRSLETPAGSLVKNRDVLALEYMGISRDAEGERFAFHICDSFDHPVCPPFHPQCSVRAKTHTRIIYRQLRPGRVGVYYRAEYASGGRIPKLLARWTAAEVAVSLGRSVECAEAKKLTAIALAAHASDDRSRAIPRRVHSITMGSVARSCSICDQHTTKALYSCDLCDAPICGKCRTRKYLLSDDGKLPVACCKQCIVAAKSLRVDARQPLAIVSAAHWHGNGAIVSATMSGAQRDVVVVVDGKGGSQALATAAASSPQCGDGQPHAWTMDHGLDLDAKPKVLRHRCDLTRDQDRRQTHEDVYDLLAAMSTTSESTVGSMASREDGSIATSDSFVDDDTSPRSDFKCKAMLVASSEVPVDGARTPSPPSPPASPSPPSPPASDGTAKLWLQMKQLRVAAEQTYRLTKKNSEHWVR